MPDLEAMRVAPAPNYTERVKRLKLLRSELVRRREELVTAIQHDFARPREEILLSEFMPILANLNHTIRSLRRWMRPQSVPKPPTLMGTRSSLIHQPKGLVLIIAPWNYPLLLTVNPLLQAWAAGNRVVVKPSEWLPTFGEKLEALLKAVFEPSQVSVFQGDAGATQQLLEEPWDHIMFTGSCAIGRKVAVSAAERSIPVTLELGGKSPVIIDRRYPIAKAARRIAWGKLLNAGQTCIGPDYVLCPADRVGELTEALAKEFNKRFKPGSRAPIIHAQAFQRLKALYQDALDSGAECAFGGSFDSDTRMIQPTLLLGVTPQMRIDQEEIFGPLLPIFGYSNADQAFEHAERKRQPLSMYIYSNDKRFCNEWIERVPAGGVCINDQTLQIVNHHLPFGGIGRSGIGAYHGVHGFRNFSHALPVVERRGPGLIRMFYMPYGFFKRQLIGAMVRFFSRWI